MKWKSTIDKRGYIGKIMTFLTANELGKFMVVFPNTDSDRKVDGAIDLIERHLLSHVNDRTDTEGHERERAQLEKEIDSLCCENAELKNNIDSLEAENKRLMGDIARLGTPSNIENANVQRRLCILDALEAGGVDNWQWYEESLKEAGL